MGSFDTKEEAALEYDRAALKYHGEHAVVNFNTTSTEKDPFAALDRPVTEVYSTEHSVSGTESQSIKGITDLQNDQSSLVSMLMGIRSMPSTGSSLTTELASDEPGEDQTPEGPSTEVRTSGTHPNSEGHVENSGLEGRTSEEHRAEDSTTLENTMETSGGNHRYNTRHIHISTAECVTTPASRSAKRRKMKKAQEGDSDESTVPTFESLLKAGSESEDSVVAAASSLSPYVAVPGLLNPTENK